MTEESNGMVMPVTPFGGNNNGNGWGGDWAWIILLLLLAGNGWGNGFGGGFGGGNDLYPWLNNSQNINGGFRDQMLNTTLTGIQNSVTSGFGDIQTALCGGFAGVNANITNTQMADMERSFAAQTATMQGFNSLQSQLAQCCCDNRAATADLKYTIASEECNTRANATANTQAILDKLCALELDGYKRENDNLRTQLNMANLAASQTAQTSRILADNAAQTVALEQYLNPVPIPAYVVQNPNCCTPSCGCNGGF